MTTLKRRDGTVIHEDDGGLRYVALEAYRKGLDLDGADLNGADLGGAYLGGAYLNGADLGGAYLGGAYLNGADLGGAYLDGADLRGADLRGAYLRGAYLRGAYLRGAYLRGAYLGGASINWSDHETLSAILMQSAGDDVARRMLAGLIAVSLDWCWDKFVALVLDKELVAWAVETLATFAEWSCPPAQFVELASRLGVAIPEYKAPEATA